MLDKVIWLLFKDTNLPNLPTLWTLQDLPDIQNTPNIPDIPDLPNIPDIPDIPDIRDFLCLWMVPNPIYLIYSGLRCMYLIYPIHLVVKLIYQASIG